MEVLSSAVLREEQARTLNSKPLRLGPAAKALFVVVDLTYGRARSLQKFRVLEVVARVTYQAWEHVAYIAVTHKHETPEFAKNIHDRITESREQQDNEQWHLLILEEILHRDGVRSKFFRGKVVPQILAFIYYQISWLLYVLKPAWSYKLNAQFEDHAEREYMKYVHEHPELENVDWQSIFTEEYGAHQSVADVLRQIGYDERVHKLSSLDLIERARFEKSA